MTKNLPKTQPLNKLFVDPANARQSHNPDSVRELAKNIAASGQLQSLLVRKAESGFGVICGGRRYSAMNLLVSEGTWKEDQAVSVMYFIGTDEEAVAASLAENSYRENMDDADSILTFTRMHNGGKGLSPEDIASRFGQSPRRVRGFIKLGTLPDAMIEKFRNKSLTLEKMEILASCQNEELLAEAVERIDEFYWASELKEFVCPDQITGAHHLAKFVGEEAYVEAGGYVRADLFSKEETTIYDDPDILKKLAMQKLEEVAKTYKDAGWEHTQVWDVDGDRHDFYRLSEVTEEFNPTDEVTSKLDELEAKLDSLYDEQADVDAVEDKDLYDSIEEQINATQEEMTALEKAHTAYPEGTKESTTATVLLDPFYGVKVKMVPLPKEQEETAEEGTEDNSEGATTESRNELEAPGEPVIKLTKALYATLLQARTFAGQVELARNPHAAKAHFVTCMLASVLDGSESERHSISLSNAEFQRFKRDEDATQPQATVKAIHHELVGKFNLRLKDPANMFAELVKLNGDDLDAILAYVIARQVNFNRNSYQPTESKDADRLLDALGTDMTEHYTVSSDLLKKLPVASIQLAVSEVGTEQEVLTVKAVSKKKDVIAAALPILQARKWVPSAIRTANTSSIVAGPAEEPAADEPAEQEAA